MPIGKLLFNMSLPMMISMLVQALYNIVDSIFVAKLSENALTAVSLAFPLQTLLIAVATGTGVGMNALLSRSLGEHKFKEANKIGVNAAFLYFLSYLVFLILGFTVVKPFYASQIKGADAEIMEMGIEYLRTVMIFSFGLLAQIYFERLLTSTGKTLFSMTSQLCGALTNIILDPIMIFVLGWGAAGAATATVIGNVCTDIFFVWFLIKKSKNLSVDPRGFHISRSEIGAVFAIGIPASVTNLMQSIGIALTNRALLGFGDDKVAAMGIVMKINMIAALVLVGFAFGGQPLTGYNYGARNRTRLKATLKFAYLLEGGMALVLMAVLGFFAPQMVKIFMSDPSVVENGALMLRLQLAGMLCMGIVLISTCTFQSAGQAMGAFLLSVSRQGVVFAVVLMIALKVAGYYGVLASQAISDFLTAVLAVVLVWRWWKKVDF